MDCLLKCKSRMYLINSYVFLLCIFILIILGSAVAEGQGLFKQLNAQQMAVIRRAVGNGQIMSSQSVTEIKLPSPGQTIWVTAIDGLGCQANWEGFHGNTCSSSAVYTPPPGYVVLQVKTYVPNNNNGNSQVSVLGGGLNLVVNQTLDKSYRELIDFAGKSGQDEAKGKLQQQYTAHKELLETYKSSNNVVHANVTASTSGTVVDRKGGSIQTLVLAQLIYIGHNNKERIKKEAAKATGLNMSKRVAELHKK